MMLLGVKNDHDLVLEFGNVNERKKLLTKLETFLQSYKKRLETVPTFKDEMLANMQRRKKDEKLVLITSSVRLTV